ncbi:MAG: thioredoxin family protein [Gloeomargaritaceae cyanobacterium C42_A2020_066]|nr:thioredoxin family protein [Gloeomargaritaceae cyanobacterium C42_A2020_066]
MFTRFDGLKTPLGAVALTVALTQPAWAAAQVGKPAPNFSGTDSNGKTVKLSDFKGKVVVLEWTNHDCPFVRKHYDTSNMQKLQQQATSKGVVWLSIISSAPGKQGAVSATQANELTTSRKASPTAVILDPKGTIGQLYGARTTPHIYIIDKQGILQYNGAIDSISSADKADVPKATNYVSSALTNVLAGRPANPATTTPYGCGVKY